MLSEIDSEQYEELFQFWRLSPWGGAREDYRAGLLAMVGQAPWTKGTPMKPEEWFPNLKDDEPPAAGFTATVAAGRDPDTGAAVPTKTPQQAAAELRAWVEACGGRVGLAS
jgi:hypothetical protein